MNFSFPVSGSFHKLENQSGAETSLSIRAQVMAGGRAGEDRAQKRDVSAAPDLFQFFPVQLTGAHPIEHPIIVARHKFFLSISSSSSKPGQTGAAWSSFGCARTMIFMAYIA
jgi:hypothetical protein